MWPVAMLLSVLCFVCVYMCCGCIAMILLDGRISLLWMRFNIRLNPIIEHITTMGHNAFIAAILILPIGADNSLIGTIGTNAFYWARWL